MIPDQLQFFHRATLEICGSLDADRMLSRCQKFLKEYFPADSITMGVYDEQKNVIQHISRVADKNTISLGHKIHAPDFIGERIRTESRDITEVTLINSPEDNPVMYRWWKSLGQLDGSFMSMTLAIDGEVIGFIGTFSKGWGRYEPGHAELFSMLRSPFAVSLKNVLQHRELLRLQDLLKDDNRYLNRELQNRSGEEIIGAGGGLKGVMEKVEKVGPLSSLVLLLGETGSGKEVIANAVHYASPRANGPFIKVNCGAIPENLIDSELFGHEKGAFTGALEQKRGRFERAHKGTLFLDEIGELPLTAQTRLLRVLQNREIERVGGTSSISVDIRIIAATNRNLEDMVAQGKFREDLFFRLNVFPIRIPPLRERPQDIPDLVRYFILKKTRDMNFDAAPIPGPEFIHALQSRAWKGNIRELENTVERVLIRHMGSTPGTVLDASDAGNDTVAQPSPDPMSSGPGHYPIGTLDAAMSSHIQSVLSYTHGKIQGDHGAAAILGVHPSTLRSRMKKLGIPFGRSENY